MALSVHWGWLMASVKRYEELDCYQLAVEIRRDVLRLTRRARVREDRRFCAQIRDSARGAPRNIAEGYALFNPVEIARFLTYARGSLNETKNHAVDGQESQYFTKEETDRLISLIKRTHGAIRRWTDYLESPRAKQFYERFKAQRQSDPIPRPQRRRRTRNR
ncbi:MAG TPA: four helix bundle protein [Vicinamibacterales bacterium]